MIYTKDYIDGFREFARRAFASPAAPVDVIIDGDGMRAYLRDRVVSMIIADPPFFGYVDCYHDATLVRRIMCETSKNYDAVLAAACKWAEDSPADRSVKADRLSYHGHYAEVTVSRERSGGPAGVPTRASLD